MTKDFPFKKTTKILIVFLAAGVCGTIVTFAQVYSKEVKGTRSSLEGAYYYVSPSGNDSNPGTESQPWRTLQRAADLAGAGDTVLVRNGIYAEQVSFSKSGNPQNYILFKAYSSETPVIQGEGIGIGTAVHIRGSYFQFEGFEIRKWDTGIEMTGHHIEIRDCRVHDLWCGISPHDGCHDFILERVDISRFYLYGFDASPWGSSEDACYNGTFNDCVAHDCLDPQQNVDGFAFGGGHDFIFDHCTVFNVFDGFDIKADKTTLQGCWASQCFNSGYKLWADNIDLINCIGFDNGGNHVELDWDGDPGSSELMNCTFFKSEIYGIWVENSQDRLSMHNCIIAGGDNIGLCFEQRSAGNYQGNYNIFHNKNPNRVIVVGYEDEFSLDQVRGGAWTDYSAQDQYSLVVSDPNNELFMDSLNGDLHLMEGSLAIDTGTSVNAPLIDFDGMIRPAGSGHDIGAYEYGSTIDPGSINPITRKKKLIGRR